MSATTPHQAPPGGQEQHTRRETRRRDRLPTWLRSPFFGYLASILLVLGFIVLERLEAAFPQAPLFKGAPFALASVLAALLWGTGPALLALLLGIVALAIFIFPGMLTADLFRDAALLGPFLFLQLIAIAAVIRLERSHEALEMTHRDLEIAYQQLSRTLRLRDYFIMRASHELRTPLTTILGRLQLLRVRLEKAGNTPESWEAIRKHMETLEARALHLRSLIESLFDLSRVQAEGLHFPLVTCDFTRICQEVVANQRKLSGGAIELDVPDRQILLPADEQRLSQVVENLLSNALKYAPEGSPIHLTVAVEDHCALLRVSNSAPHLSSEQLEQFFSPFYRVSGMEYSSIPGWGLGLTISQEIVEQHGGQIWAETSVDGEVVLAVKLPLS